VYEKQVIFVAKFGLPGGRMGVPWGLGLG